MHRLPGADLASQSDRTLSFRQECDLRAEVSKGALKEFQTYKGGEQIRVGIHQ